MVPEHAAELTRVKGVSGTFQSAVSQLPADLPKIDFAALKKALPAHSAVLDSLQKQYESVKIPYGEVPAEYLKEVDQWVDYNNARIKLHEVKVADGLQEAKKVITFISKRFLIFFFQVEEKWAKAPPVEHFDRQHFVEYFPAHFYDLRYQNRIPDPCNIGLNETPEIENRFKDYKVEKFTKL